MEQANKFWQLIKPHLVTFMFALITAAVIYIASNTQKMVYAFENLTDGLKDTSIRVDKVEEKVYIINGKVIELDKRTEILEKTYGKND